MRGKFVYTGIDVTAAYVAKVAERWHGYDNAVFLLGSAMDLPFSANTFDIVFNSGVLIHIRIVSRCLRQFARVAKSYLLIRININPRQQHDFTEEGTSGKHSIHRAYRPRYIGSLLGEVGTIVKGTSVPRPRHQSILFEALFRTEGNDT